MSAKEYEYPSESRKTLAIVPAVLAFVVGGLLAAMVMYLIAVAPGSAERVEARETIAELEDEMAQLEAQGAELRATAGALEADLEEERARSGALEEENQSLRTALEEAREQEETVERLERELAEMAAEMEAVEAVETESAEALAEMEALEAAIGERDAELEEARQAHRAALERVEQVEAEREEIREDLQREIDALEERLMAVPEQTEVAAPVIPWTEPHRYTTLLSAFLEARQESIAAEDPERARAASTRAERILDILEAEFPERSADRLRR